VGASLLLALALIFVVIARPSLGAALREPEPATPGSTRELTDLYAVRRVTKAWGMYWVFLALVTAFSASAVCGVWMPNGAVALKAVVSVAGNSVGIGGAVLGIYLAHQRGRISSLLLTKAAS
jgi:hypothetical protein